MLMANKKQELSEHLLRVASLSKKIIESLDLNDNFSMSKEKVMKIAYLAGMLHDLGKVDPVFQSYLLDKTTTDFNQNGVHIEKKGFSFETHPRHNEISWFILEEMFNNKDLKLNKTEFRILKNIVLWHHSSPIRKEDFTSSEIKLALKKEKETFKSNLESLLSSLEKENEYKDALSLNVESEDIDESFNSEKKKLIDYKSFLVESTDVDMSKLHTDIRCEAISSLIRSVVVTADKHVSTNGSDFNVSQILNDIIEENKYSELCDSIQKMEDVFYPYSERSNTQLQAAKKLSSISKTGDIAILDAPAGAGKTKVSLQWLKEEKASKAYYIVPRTIIAEEIFDELKTVYLKKNVSFEIITGEKQVKWTGSKQVELEEQHEFYKSDIVITTIDQLIKSTTTHKNISLLQDVIQSHVIFDEYHEYYKMSGLDLLFSEIIKLKSFFRSTKTMIMSATPNYFMLENLLDIYSESSSNIVSFQTTNKQDFKMNYLMYQEGVSMDAFSLFNEAEGYDYKVNPMLKDIRVIDGPFYRTWDDKKTIIISNTATMAQKSFIVNHEKENSLLAHAKLKQEDKINILSEIKSNFSCLDVGKNILRAGPIVQASLNITSERLITDLTSPERTLQRLGRVNRFGAFFIGDFIIAVPLKALDEKIALKSNVLTLLSRSHEKESTLLWLNFLIGKFSNQSNFTLDEIYSAYKEFYSMQEVKDVLSKELQKSLENSYRNIKNNILNPVDLIGSKKKTKKEEKIFAKKSLRGKSYNTKMAVYDCSNAMLSLTSDYADEVSLPRELILKYDENYDFVKETVKRQDILTDDVDKKVQRLLKKAKKEKSDKYYAYVLDQARKSSFNIYTSFSKDDLEKLNKMRNSVDDYVYVKTDDQVVGYLRLKQLINY